MTEFYFGLGVGILLVLVVDIIYYVKYLDREKRFKKTELEMMKRMDVFFEEHSK